jgi:hypothetical protein
MCTCPDVVLNAGAETGSKNWSDACDEHGVGTPYFKAMPVKPFGYGSEAKTTRKQWLAYLAKERGATCYCAETSTRNCPVHGNG